MLWVLDGKEKEDQVNIFHLSGAVHNYLTQLQLQQM
jgi:hypothetical protein